MKYIESPEIYKNFDSKKSIFLAGGITNCPDWQLEMVERLKNHDIILLNPRRKKFPINVPTASKEQIQWEFEHMRRADTILFWFPKESICPIALYELGAWCMTDKLLWIGVHPNYERKVDIEEQTKLARPEIIIAYDLKDLADQVKMYLKDNPM